MFNTVKMVCYCTLVERDAKQFAQIYFISTSESANCSHSIDMKGFCCDVVVLNALTLKASSTAAENILQFCFPHRHNTPHDW